MRKANTRRVAVFACSECGAVTVGLDVRVTENERKSRGPCRLVRNWPNGPEACVGEIDFVGYTTLAWPG